jgi:hypothetical protein
MRRQLLFSLMLVAGGIAGSLSGCPGGAQNVCANDEACGPFAVCVDGSCAQPCRADDDCSAAKFCDGVACRDGCRDDSSCAQGERCADHVCSGGCSTGSDCPDGFACREQQCVQGCLNDSDCGAGAFCDEGACQSFGVPDAGVAACSRDGDCRVGEICEEGSCRVGRRTDAGPIPVDAGPPAEWVLTCYAGAADGDEHNRGFARGETGLVADSNRDGVTYAWELTDHPGGSGVAIESANRAEAVLTSRRVGVYRVSLSASLGDQTKSCALDVQIVPPPGLWLEMGWDGSRDLDLHMTVVPDEPRCGDDNDCRRAPNDREECNLEVCTAGFDSRGDRDADCWAANMTPEWGDPADESTNPRYLEDVRRGAGTENIKLEHPESVYRIALRSWGDNENRAYLKVFLDGNLLHEVTERRIGSAEGMGWYYFGQLHPNPGGYDFVTIDEVSEEPPRN